MDSKDPKTYELSKDAAHGAPESQPLAELINRLSFDFKQLVEREAAVAKHELSGTLTQAKQEAAALALGAAALAGGALVLLSAAVLGLALVMPAWLAALLVGLVVSALGAGLFFAGKSKLSKLQLEPKQTLANVSRDVNAIKRAAT